MMKLMFEKERHFFLITIENRKVLYWDKKVSVHLQYLPPDPNIDMKIRMSRNKLNHNVKELLKISQDDLKDFENAKDDNEIKDLVIRDAKTKGCVLVDLKIE